MPMQQAGKVYISEVSNAEVQAYIGRKRIEAQNIVSAPTTVEDYRQEMWQVYQEMQAKIADADRVLQQLRAREKSPLASTVFGDVVQRGTHDDIRTAEETRSRLQQQAGAIWSGMTAWGKQQKPDHHFFVQLHQCIEELEKEEALRFEQSKQMPSDVYALDAWKKVARKKQILFNFERFLQMDR